MYRNRNRGRRSFSRRRRSFGRRSSFRRNAMRVMKGAIARRIGRRL